MKKEVGVVFSDTEIRKPKHNRILLVSITSKKSKYNLDLNLAGYFKKKIHSVTEKDVVDLRYGYSEDRVVCVEFSEIDKADYDILCGEIKYQIYVNKLEHKVDTVNQVLVFYSNTVTTFNTKSGGHILYRYPDREDEHLYTPVFVRNVYKLFKDKIDSLRIKKEEVR